jgi:hypothetical protein
MLLEGQHAAKSCWIYNAMICRTSVVEQLLSGTVTLITMTCLATWWSLLCDIQYAHFGSFSERTVDLIRSHESLIIRIWWKKDMMYPNQSFYHVYLNRTRRTPSWLHQFSSWSLVRDKSYWLISFLKSNPMHVIRNSSSQSNPLKKLDLSSNKKNLVITFSLIIDDI